MGAPDRVLITDVAAELVARLVARHGPVMFHQSGGCCDGSAPMCYPDGDFIIGDHDVLLGILDLENGEPASKCRSGSPVHSSPPGSTPS